MEIKEIQNIFKEHGFNENNCSFFIQEDINDIAKEIVEKINYTLCSTELLDFEQWREKQVILPDTARETLEEYFKWKAIT